MTTLWYQHPECLPYSTNPNTYFIHGHICTHELFAGFSYTSLFTLLQHDPDRIYVYAHHPLMNDAPNEYERTCNDFGYQLPRMYYDPLCTATQDQLWNAWTRLHWQHRPNEIQQFSTAYMTNTNTWTTSVWQRVFPEKSYAEMVNSLKT